MKLAICALLVACGGKKTTEEPHGNLDKLAITGKDLKIDRAFLTEESPDFYTLHLSAGKGTCLQPQGVFGFSFAKRVAPLGHERFVIIDAFAREFAVIPGKAGTVTFDGKHVGNIDLGGEVTAKGEVEPVVCPPAKRSGLGVPKIGHGSKATITIGGKDLHVRGVTVQTRLGVEAADMPNIWISTNEKDCSKVTLPAPVILERVDKKWSLRGTWLEAPVENVEAPELMFTANGFGKSADGPILELQLNGKAKLGEYTVEIVGTVEAIECVR